MSKKQLLKKGYAFMLLVSGIFSLTVANAQIVYTDVNPDITITQDTAGTASHDIDINNDGTTDVTITAEWVEGDDPFEGPYTLKDVWAATSAGSEVLMDSAFNILLSAKPINYNAVVDSASETWSGSTNARLVSNPTGANFFPFGAWSDTTDRYLAIRIPEGSDWLYGWVRVSVAQDSISFTIRDYAYNSIPNQPILAGQTNTSGIIDNSFTSSINLFPNPATDHLTIALPNANEKVEITITDITGKIIHKTISRETQKIEVNTQDFGEGIYSVQIQTAEFIGTKKFIVEK